MLSWVGLWLLLVGESRLWYLDAELLGPLPAFELATAAGTLQVESALLAGERRSLRLPFPARSPLGVAGLHTTPLPTLPPELEGKVELRGWSDEQSVRRLAALPRGLLARPVPVAGDDGVSVRKSDALLWLAALLTVGAVLRSGSKSEGNGAAGRGRGVAAVLLGLLFGGGLAAMGAHRESATGSALVLEGDLALGAWLEVRSSVGKIEGEFDALEVAPEESPLRFEVDRAGNLSVVGADPLGSPLRLTTRTVLPGLDPGRLPQLGLAAVWIRSAGGEGDGRGWVQHAPWPLGTSFPEPFEGSAAGLAPPGWLAGGLPSGVGVLVGRIEGQPEGWVRAIGFGEGEELRR